MLNCWRKKKKKQYKEDLLRKHLTFIASYETRKIHHNVQRHHWQVCFLLPVALIDFAENCASTYCVPVYCVLYRSVYKCVYVLCIVYLFTTYESCIFIYCIYYYILKLIILPPLIIGNSWIPSQLKASLWSH